MPVSDKSKSVILGHILSNVNKIFKSFGICLLYEIIFKVVKFGNENLL